VQGAVSDGVVDVDDELCVGGQLVSEQRLDAAEVVEQLTVFRDASQLCQRTCHVRHHLQTQQPPLGILQTKLQSVITVSHTHIHTYSLCMSM